MSIVTHVPASPQEYLDLLVAKSVAGELPAIDQYDNIRFCRYRTRKGIACGAGLLIPDADYDACMEGITAETLFTDYTRLCPTWATPAQLAQIQAKHDSLVLNERRPPWSHETWVWSLLECDLFHGLTPTAHRSGDTP